MERSDLSRNSIELADPNCEKRIYKWKNFSSELAMSKFSNFEILWLNPEILRAWWPLKRQICLLDAFKHLFLGKGGWVSTVFVQKCYLYLSKILCIFVTGSGRLTKLHAGSGFDPRQGSSQKLTLNRRTLSILAKKKLANNSDFWLVNQDKSWPPIGQYFGQGQG